MEIETITKQMKKPLGQTSYGHIPHLPGSRMGPADKKCHEGQERIATIKARNKHDMIVIQEKLDGSNVSIARVAGEIVALGRAGYTAESSQYEMHRRFDTWVKGNIARFDFLEDGERLCGEWLIQAHGTRYDLPHEPFVAFDLMRLPHKRAPFESFMSRVEGKFVTPKVLSVGPPRDIEWVLERLEPSGHGALDPVEGAVWRVEQKGEVDFLVKYVRPDKQDGKYLPGVNGNWQEPVWNSFK